MRVLVVTNMFPSPADPSAGIFIRREVSALEARDPAITIQVVHIPTTSKKYLYLTGSRRVRDAFQRFRPNLVHVHYGLTLAVVRGWQGPRVVTLHGSDVHIPWQRAITKAFLRATDQVVCVSEAVAEKVGPGLACRIVPCGVDTEIFRPLDRRRCRAMYGWEENDIVVGFPSDPSRPEKRYGLFEAVVAELTRRGVPVRTAVVAGLEGKDVPLLLNAIDVLLYTSSREGSPVTSKEALCCGTRLVGVDVGDLRAQAASFSGTRVVGERAPEALANAVIEALREAPPDAAVAAEAFSVERQAEAILQVYEAATSGHGDPRACKEQWGHS